MSTRRAGLDFELEGEDDVFLTHAGVGGYGGLDNFGVTQSDQVRVRILGPCRSIPQEHLPSARGGVLPPSTSHVLSRAATAATTDEGSSLPTIDRVFRPGHGAAAEEQKAAGGGRRVRAEEVRVSDHQMCREPTRP